MNENNSKMKNHKQIQQKIILVTTKFFLEHDIPCRAFALKMPRENSQQKKAKSLNKWMAIIDIAGGLMNVQ